MLSHPSLIDSISISVSQEDHVSMSSWSIQKALKVINNIEIFK